MSTSRFSVDDHASLRASPATAAGNSQGTLSQPPSRAVGVETVRSLTLMLMAACLTTLVLLTQRLDGTVVRDAGRFAGPVAPEQ